MAHVGQERTLGLVRGIGALTGIGQFSRAFLHQFLQMITVLVQLFGDTLFLGDVLLGRNVVGNAPVCTADR